MLRTNLAATLAIALTAGSLAFTATDVGGDRVFFQCETSGVNTNMEASTGSWSDEAPSGAMMSGSGGCFSFDTWQGGDAYRDTIFTGTYDGAFDEIALHFFGGSLSPATQAGLLAPAGRIVLTVDGEVVFETGEDATEFAVGGDGPFPGTNLWETTLSNLGVGEGEHEIELVYGAFYTDDPQFVMYGSSDADAGITFNPEDRVGTVYKA